MTKYMISHMSKLLKFAMCVKLNTLGDVGSTNFVDVNIAKPDCRWYILYGWMSKLN